MTFKNSRPKSKIIRAKDVDFNTDRYIRLRMGYSDTFRKFTNQY